MKITGLLKKDVFKIIIFHTFITLDKVYISNKFVTSNKILSNI